PAAPRLAVSGPRGLVRRTPAPRRLDRLPIVALRRDGGRFARSGVDRHPHRRRRPEASYGVLPDEWASVGGGLNGQFAYAQTVLKQVGEPVERDRTAEQEPL